MRLQLQLQLHLQLQLRPPPCTTTSTSFLPSQKSSLRSRSPVTRRHKVTTPPLRLTITNSAVLHQPFEFGAGAVNSAHLGNKWMEYQGVNNWDGLLDPLDDTLRNEILRYGKFVEATYRSCDFDLKSPTFGACKFPRSSLLNRSEIGYTGYELTSNLRATCGVRPPRWFHGAPAWMSTQSSWIGYVAVCQDKEEIARLGRRDVVIAFRGTATLMEWVENLRASLTSLVDSSTTDVGGGGGGDPMVGRGFWSLYTSKLPTCPSLQEMVRAEIRRVIRTYGCGDEPISITITGHSLGAALATLAAYDIATTFEHAPTVTVVSFGGPRVGNESFRCQMEKSGTKVLRIVNSDDVITKVPGFVIDNNEVAVQAAAAGGLPSWLRKSVEAMQLEYADVGQELRLSSRVSPYFNKKYDVATCHDLNTYLHLVNGFVSSTCPFRATATRMLERQSREEAFV